MNSQADRAGDGAHRAGPRPWPAPGWSWTCCCPRGIAVRVVDTEAADLGCPGAEVVPATPEAARGRRDGDRARRRRHAAAGRPRWPGRPGCRCSGSTSATSASWPRRSRRPARRDRPGGQRRYAVEQRMTVDVTVRQNGTVTATTWALNEASVEKVARERMIEVVTEIDGRPLSRWGCDGVVCATPTGSTAYAFSAGGPVVWPEVEALLMVPISAHALFAGPLVVSPVLGARGGGDQRGRRRPVVRRRAVVRGRRRVDLPPGARVEVRRGASRCCWPGCAATGTPRRGWRAVHRPAGGQVRPAGGRLARAAAGPGQRTRQPGHRTGAARPCLRKSGSPRSASSTTPCWNCPPGSPWSPGRPERARPWWSPAWA